MNDYRNILVPVDGSATSTKALAAALNIAREANGRVRLVHAVDVLAHLAGFGASGQVFAIVREAGERVLAEAADLAKAAGVPCESVLFDKPGERLGETMAREASTWGADLVVVGTHGRRGVQRALLGSGAEEIIRLATVPVLVIRHGDGGS